MSVAMPVVPDDGVSVGLPIERLFREHHAGLLRLAVVLTGDRTLADDLVQEAFIRLQRSRAVPRSGAELAYLRRTVVNLSHGHHRHLEVVRRLTPPTPDADPRAHTDDAVERSETHRRVAAAVRRLPDRQRDCVALHYFADLSDAAIADVLGISAGSVKTHLHRARAALATALEDLR